MLAVIHWEINGITGHGSPVDAAEAAIWVRVMNYKYGSGTHWLIVQNAR